MRLASMAGMQVDPATEELFSGVFDTEAFEPNSSVSAVPKLTEEEHFEPDVERETSEGLERFVRFIQSKKRHKNDKSLAGRATRAYETQRCMEQANETVGMRLDKAG